MCAASGCDVFVSGCCACVVLVLVCCCSLRVDSDLLRVVLFACWLLCVVCVVLCVVCCVVCVACCLLVVCCMVWVVFVVLNGASCGCCCVVRYLPLVVGCWFVRCLQAAA